MYNPPLEPSDHRQCWIYTSIAKPPIFPPFHDRVGFVTGGSRVLAIARPLLFHPWFHSTPPSPSSRPHRCTQRQPNVVVAAAAAVATPNFAPALPGRIYRLHGIASVDAVSVVALYSTPTLRDTATNYCGRRQRNSL
jgi:hypothetical protein